jgi:alpha-galactosidase/6-phospho-beta-glucosidase family protein
MKNSFMKNLNTFKKEKELKERKLRNKPILNIRSITEHNIHQLNHLNFLKILEFIIDDVNYYKKKVIEDKYYKKYIPEGSLKEEQMQMIFKHLIEKFQEIMKKSQQEYEKYKDDNETALKNYIEITGDPTSSLKLKKDGLLKSYTDRLIRIKEMLFLLDTQIEENQPEVLLRNMINNIKEKELFLPLMKEN